jgi:hypothetical protein
LTTIIKAKFHYLSLLLAFYYTIIIITKFLSCQQQHETLIQHIYIISHNFFDILHVRRTWFSNYINYNSLINSKYIIYIYIYIYSIAFLKCITPTMVNELLFSRPKRYDICLHPSQELDLHQFLFFFSSIIHNINTNYHFCLTIRYRPTFHL